MQGFRKKYIGKIPGVQFCFPITHWKDFQSSDGLKIATYFWPSKLEKPNSCVIIFHGFKGHANYSTLWADAYSQYSHVLAMDMRGAGYSQGERITVNNFDQVVQDALDFTLIVYREFNLPIFLHGESIGGTISTHVVSKLSDLIYGIVFLAPAFLHSSCKNNCVSFYLAWLACCCPCVELKVRVDYSGSTRNPYVQKYLLEDQLYYKEKGESFRTLGSLLRGIRQASRLASFVKQPILIVFGDDDRVTSLDSAREFLARVNTLDKKLIEIPHARHFLGAEPEILEIKEMIMEWFSARVNNQ